MNLSLFFMARIGRRKTEWAKIEGFVCFTEEKVCFEMEIYQLLALWYWLFSGSLQSARQRGVRGTVRGVRGMRGTQKIKKN